MSAIAELQAPLRRLNLGGTVFLQGVPKPVDYDTARQLAGNRRFKVTGLDTREAVEALAQSARPEGDALMEAIKEAEGQLDVEDASTFDRDDKVSIHALSDKLGYKITVQERDRALGYAKAPTTGGQLEAANGKTEKTRNFVVKRPSAPPAAEKPAEGGDPTTAGAITA